MLPVHLDICRPAKADFLDFEFLALGQSGFDLLLRISKFLLHPFFEQAVSFFFRLFLLLRSRLLFEGVVVNGLLSDHLLMLPAFGLLGSFLRSLQKQLLFNPSGALLLFLLLLELLQLFELGLLVMLPVVR